MEEYKVKIGMQLDEVASGNLKSQIESVTSKKYNIKFDFSSAKSQVAELKRELTSLGNIRIKIGTTNSGISGSPTGIKQTVNEMDWAYKQMLSIQKSIGSLRIKIGGLDSGKNKAEITELTTQLKGLESDYLTIQKTFNMTNLSTEQWGKLQTVIETTEAKLSQLDAKVVDTKVKLATSINSGLSSGEFSKNITNMEAGMSRLSTVTTELQADFQLLQTSYKNMQSAQASGNEEKLIAEYQVYEQTLKRVSNSLAEATKNQQMYQNAQKLDAAKTNLSNQMDIWLRNNSAAAKQFGATIEQLRAELQSCDATRFNGIKSEFQAITQQATLAGKSTMTFGDHLKTQLSKYGYYLSGAMMITQSIRALKEMYQTVIAVDTSMVGLKRVTNLTSDGYSQMYQEMTQSAKEYGATLTDIIDGTTTWVKLGFDAKTSERLSEITTMYQHVTDLDVSTATENLVTAYKGFQDQLTNLYQGDSTKAIEYVADIFDKLGNEYAVTAADVGESLTKCASALSLAGNTIQETSGMVTGITEVTQDPSKAGASLKILSLRLRGMKGELQDLGEDIDENVESISKMQTQLLNLSHGKVNIFDNKGDFKSTYEIMNDIAEVFNDLTDTEQADLLETISGKNRANDIGALIRNWEQVKSATEAAYKAEGTASKENETYMDGLQGKLNSMTAAWQAFANSFMKSDFLKGLIDGLTTVGKLLDGIISNVGTLPTLIGAVTAAMSLKNVGRDKMFSLYC